MQAKKRPVVLYIHGFESSPTPAKTSALADLGCTVIAPQIHYKESRGTYERLKKLIEYFQVDWIVGSSLGGYTAFWLSQEFKIPALLFNPALPFSKIDPGLVPNPHPINFLKQVVFFGLKDTTVDPVATKIWIQSNIPEEGISFIEYPENGHQISIEVFKEIIQQAAQQLEITSPIAVH